MQQAQQPLQDFGMATIELDPEILRRLEAVERKVAEHDLIMKSLASIGEMMPEDVREVGEHVMSLIASRMPTGPDNETPNWG